jgi:hypothetical protein
LPTGITLDCLDLLDLESHDGVPHGDGDFGFDGPMPDDNLMDAVLGGVADNIGMF